MPNRYWKTLLLAALLLFGAQPAHGQISDLVFRGTPEHKVESYEDEEMRYSLGSEEAAEAQVVIVATEDGCVWRSRGDRPLVATISGGYIIFEIRSTCASYVKLVRAAEGRYAAPSENGYVFLEHISQGLNTISYRGLNGGSTAPGAMRYALRHSGSPIRLDTNTHGSTVGS